MFISLLYVKYRPVARGATRAGAPPSVKYSTDGEGGGFEISDIPERGVVCESSDVRKFLRAIIKLIYKYLIKLF